MGTNGERKSRDYIHIPVTKKHNDRWIGAFSCRINASFMFIFFFNSYICMYACMCVHMSMGEQVSVGASLFGVELQVTTCYQARILRNELVYLGRAVRTMNCWARHFCSSEIFE